MAYPFKIGTSYTRDQVCVLLGIPKSRRKGDWYNGYHRHGADWYVFVNVQSSGRTGHNYGNKWLGKGLKWRGKTGSKLIHKSIQSLLKPAGNVLIFTRTKDREPFVFQGYGSPGGTKPTSPVTVLWQIQGKWRNNSTSSHHNLHRFPETASNRAWVVLRKPHGRDRIAEFLSQSIVAIGWPSKRFFGMSPGDIRTFVQGYDQTRSKAEITGGTNAICAFVRDMEEGDLVLVPEGKVVHVGTITSRYRYDATKSSDDEGYANQRKVTWQRPPVRISGLPAGLQRALKARFPPARKLLLSMEGLKALTRSANKVDVAHKGGNEVEATAGRPVGERAEASIRTVLARRTIEISRKHNSLTNAFRKAFKRKFKLSEGKYDILVQKWRASRWLLIEAKSHVNNGIGRHQVREAIGQLYDYRMLLEKKGHKNVDLALLVPEPPIEEIRELVHHRLGIELIWKYEHSFRGTPLIEEHLCHLGKSGHSPEPDV